jgi:NTE family protein
LRRCCRTPPIRFPIIVGTSAGAVSAAVLGTEASRWQRAVAGLEHVWAHFHVQQVFRVDAGSMLRSGLHWLLSLISGGVLLPPPLALFDNSPLRSLLERHLEWPGLQSSIDGGHLRSLALCATSYSSASSVAFFQGAPTPRVGAPAARRPAHRTAARSRDGEPGRAVPVSAGAARG